MIDAFHRLLEERGYVPDAAQAAAAERLELLHSELVEFKAARGHKLRRVFLPPVPPRGLYFWGGVGRGKSLLMDCFYEVLGYRRKKRMHFHAFMQRIHRDLDRFRGEPDPMRKVAEQIAIEVRVLCFDEFHVSDIADAMILARLLEGLFLHGVVLVMTSNYPPDGLYPNGLQRDRFLPAIELLKRNLEVVEVDAGIDYRMRTLEAVEVYHHPAGAEAEEKMLESFRRMAGGDGEAGGEIEILGRAIPVRRRAEGVTWFDFKHLCGGPRSQNDYLEIAHRCHMVLLSNIPRMTAAQSSEARRFTWLVDIFYDHRVKLVASAEAAPAELYVEGTQAGEFSRTVSRLTEMRSQEYLARPHCESETCLQGRADALAEATS